VSRRVSSVHEVPYCFLVEVVGGERNHLPVGERDEFSRLEHTCDVAHERDQGDVALRHDPVAQERPRHGGRAVRELAHEVEGGGGDAARVGVGDAEGAAYAGVNVAERVVRKAGEGVAVGLHGADGRGLPSGVGFLGEVARP